jgi:transcriptional regulator with XRE-family HTH domain
LDTFTELRIGERVQHLREQRGMSRPVLAGLCGRSSDWLKQIESGKRPLRNYILLVRLATALRVADLSAITGDVGVTQRLGPECRPFGDELSAIWDAVHGHGHQAEVVADGRQDVASMRGRIERAWLLWHRSPRNRSEVLALLPHLIRGAETATRNLDGVARRRGQATLAAAYRLASQATAHLAPAELAWLIASRAVSCAEQADDPVTMGAAAWNMGNLMRDGEDPRRAIQVVTDAAARLQPHLSEAGPGARGIYGALHLHAAVTAARQGRDGEAWSHWDAGEAVARALPAGYVEPTTVFGRANVQFHAVSVATDLRKAGRALQMASELDPNTMPSLERRARLWIEVARGHLQRGDMQAATTILALAHEVNPETVRHTPAARTVATDLWRRAPAGLRPQAVRLAERVGVAPAES